MKPYIYQFRRRLGVASLSLALIGSAMHSPALWAKLVDKTLLQVNGEVVLQSDIASFREKLQSKGYRDLFGGLTDQDIKDDKKLLQLLVEEKIIDQQVSKLELGASDVEVDGQIKSIVKRNGITKEQLALRLKQMGTSLKEYEEGIKRQIERRNLIEKEIKPSLEISTEQLKRFYAKNNQSSEKNARYKFSLILISKGGKARAQKVYDTVQASPDKFSEHAKNFSDEPSSAEQGGMLGEFAFSDMSAFFQKHVPTLEVGKIKGPIQSPSGYYILKLHSKTDGGYESLTEEEKNVVKNQMLAIEVDRLMNLWLDRKKREAYIKQTS